MARKRRSRRHDLGPAFRSATRADTTAYACAVATKPHRSGAKRSVATNESGSSTSGANTAGTRRPATRKTAGPRRPAEPPELRRAIGERLASLRRESGQTQEQISSQAGRRKSWLAKIERGQRSLLFSEAVELAELLGTPINNLWPDP